MNIEVTKKISGDTSIFGSDQLYVTQEAKCAYADIFEIPNRRRNQIQRSHVLIVS